ncbi:MAG: formate--tetrahydrofolate ligase, partial [Candidatus Bipolaricaulota bacterium]
PDGGAGSVDLAKAVVEATEEESDFEFLYDVDKTIKEKIETIAKEVYGADDVDYSGKAEKQISDYEESGFGDLPICMAKTHLSLSHDAKKKGVPTGFTLPVREVRASVGAGFVYPLCGEMSTMPGLPSKPAYMDVDIDDDGNVVGLF